MNKTELLTMLNVEAQDLDNKLEYLYSCVFDKIKMERLHEIGYEHDIAAAKYATLCHCIYLIGQLELENENRPSNIQV